MLSKEYRRYEQFAKKELEERGNQVELSSSQLDVKGVDLVGVNAKGETLGIYARARFGNYRDITFNGMGAVQKLVANCQKYDNFGCVLHYATGQGFTDPDSGIYQTTFINLKAWVADNDYDAEKLRRYLVWKNQNGGFFILPKPVWEKYAYKTIEYDPPVAIGM